MYDAIDRHIKTIRRISANNIESYLADITEIEISDIEIDNSYWGFGRYCV